MRHSRLVFAILASLTMSTGAQACRGPQFEQTMLFDKPPFGIKADSIARVTITAIEFVSLGKQVAWTEVHEMIQGAEVGKKLKLVNYSTSCGPYLQGNVVGWSGYVAGWLKKDQDGESFLLVAGESVAQREKRIRPSP